MSIFDIIILAVLIFAIVRGAIIGIFKQLGVLVGVVLALLFTRVCSSLVSDLVYWITSGGTRLEGTLFYAIVFVAIVLLTYIVSILLHKTSKAMNIGWINSLAGALFSAVKFMLLTGVLLKIYLSVYSAVCGAEPPPIKGVLYEPLMQSFSALMDFVGNYGITYGN